MCRRFAVLIFFLSMLVAVLPIQRAAAEEITLSDDNVPYLYESRAKVPAPDYKLAEMISVEYRGARDEFTKRDLFKKIKPLLDEQLAQGRAVMDVVIRVNTTIGEYDFDKHAFPTGFNETTYVPFENGYAATFTNNSDIALLPMPEELARNFAALLREGRQGTLVIKAKVVGVEEKKIDAWRSKVLKLRITEFTLLHGSGKRFGTMTM